jgi:hypothetical protein
MLLAVVPNGPRHLHRRHCRTAAHPLRHTVATAKYTCNPNRRQSSWSSATPSTPWTTIALCRKSPVPTCPSSLGGGSTRRDAKSSQYTLRRAVNVRDAPRDSNSALYGVSLVRFPRQPVLARHDQPVASNDCSPRKRRCFLNGAPTSVPTLSPPSRTRRTKASGPNDGSHTQPFRLSCSSLRSPLRRNRRRPPPHNASRTDRGERPTVGYARESFETMIPHR